MLTLIFSHDQIDEALATVERFFERYPPTALRTPPPLTPYDSTRPLLVSPHPRPLVRIVNKSEVGDDLVPPMLTFRDVETLHHRLVLINDKVGLNGLTYVLRSYQGNLRMRRKETLNAVVSKEMAKEVTPIGAPVNA